MRDPLSRTVEIDLTEEGQQPVEEEGGEPCWKRSHVEESSFVEEEEVIGVSGRETPPAATHTLGTPQPLLPSLDEEDAFSFDVDLGEVDEREILARVAQQRRRQYTAVRRLPGMEERAPLAANVVRAQTKRFGGPLLWSQQTEILGEEEMVLHKTKIQELKTWVSSCAFSSRWDKRAPCLLLVGPCGCGKSSLLKSVCRWFGVEIVSFQGLDDEDVGPKSEDESFSNTIHRLDRFRDFLMRARRLDRVSLGTQEGNVCLPSGRTPYLIHLQDLPLTSSPQQYRKLQVLLTNLCEQTTAPVVLERSFDTKDTPSHTLFTELPRDLLNSSQVTCISMNPIPPTRMKKALLQMLSWKHVAVLGLKGIAAAKQRGFSKRHAVSSQDLDLIIESSEGDLRSALNELQLLAATRPGVEALRKKREKSSRNTTSVTLRTAEVADLLRMQWRTQETDNLPTSKDTWLSMHHATGRVLYNKSEWLYRLLQLFFCCDCVLWERLV